MLFATGPWSVVYAIDARAGKLLWTFDPQVPRRYGRIACCDVVNRGVALYKGKLFVGTLDGRLIALDPATGAKLWETLTVDPERAYTITGAPRVVEGKIIIGNGGAELGVRGYVSAYDPEDGQLVWRFYTVPGDPSKPFESPALASAAKTWNGELVGSRRRRHGVGLDGLRPGARPALHRHRQRLAVGAQLRAARAGGDNLYLSSILALQARDRRTGLALPDHARRQLGLHRDAAHDPRRPRDRREAAQGDHAGAEERLLLRARPRDRRVPLREAVREAHLGEGPRREGPPDRVPDGNYDRSDEADLARADRRSQLAADGLRSEDRASSSSRCRKCPARIALDKNFKFKSGSWNTANALDANLDVPDGWSEVVKARLVAWDPATQQEAWRAEYKSGWNGGALATAGNLVFEGTADGRVVAYRASDGKLLWESPAGTGVMAAPITYLVDGVQYVTVMAGWGGAYPLAYGEAGARAGVTSVGRVLTYKLGGTAALPPAIPHRHVADPAAADEDRRRREAAAPGRRPLPRVVRGLSRPEGRRGRRRPRSAPRERRRPTRSFADDRARRRAPEPKGMPSFADVLSPEDVRLIQAYVLQRARAQPSATQQAKPIDRRWPPLPAPHAAFLARALERLRGDARLVGVAAAGSFARARDGRALGPRPRDRGRAGALRRRDARSPARSRRRSVRCSPRSPASTSARRAC